MPDIAMCKNDECKLKRDCYRYLAIPNEHVQTYSDFNPEADNFCSHQIKIE